MIKKETNMKEAIDTYPEIASLLAKSGLGCVGCHASSGETIEEGCKVHGFDDERIDSLIKDLNARIKEFDSKEKLDLTKKAEKKLKEKLLKSKDKFVRIIPIFQGFDFETTSEKKDNEVLLEKEISLLVEPGLERFLRGVIIDFDENEDDFAAKRKEK
jgi:hybrid cluster-associated redox disulfide protein